MFQCINLFQNGQSLLLLWHNNKPVYPPELPRIAGFCTNSYKIFLGEDPKTPPLSKQNCLSLYYNHNTANHLKKFNKYPNLLPPLHHFSGELKIIWSLYVLFEKSIVDHFSANGCLKEQRKVLENSLKMYLKSPWKVLEKGMSWSVGTMFLVPFWSQIFDVFLDFVILPYFNAISMDFYAVKCLIYIYFV